MRARILGGKRSKVLGRLIAGACGALAMVLLAPQGAQAQFLYWFSGPQKLVWHGNDTGGVIPWSCENEAAAQAAAAAYCAQWHKYSRITGVSREYGDFISFNCLWRPDIARSNLPAVPTRNVCAGEPRQLLTK